MVLVGKTGSGKTTLALALLPTYRSVLVIDPIHVLTERLPLLHDGNGERNRDGFVICSSPEELAEKGASFPKLLYQPEPTYMEWEAYDLVYHWVFNRKNTMVYTDEGLRVMRPNGQAPRYMEACYTAGRQRGVGMITATQRPSKVDLRVMSEAEHYACFQLKLKADRERMAELMGEEVLRSPKEHGFWYADDYKHEKPLLLRLEED
jgi:hypothetical protein